MTTFPKSPKCATGTLDRIRSAGSAALVATTAILLGLAGATDSFSGLAPEVRCEVGKLKTVASYASCRLKEDAKATSKGQPADFDKCESKINSKFPKLDEQGGGACIVENDLSDIRGRTDDFEATIAILLSGGTLPPTVCGDGAIDIGEECDVGDLDGESCATLVAGSGTLRCGPGCVFDTSECVSAGSRFEDTGNTVIDHDTGLEWEKKNASDAVANLANPHDVDNGYTWAASGSAPSGTLYTDFLVKLNGTVDDPTKTTLGCFEGFCDWRIPTVDELKTITDLSPCNGGAPCVVDDAFLPDRSGGYWTGSTRASLTTGAYFADHSTGAISVNIKTTTYFARAVRTAE